MKARGQARGSPPEKGCTLRTRGVWRWQSGQTLLEVALLLPLLLMLLIGVIELGRYAYISILVGNAARAGAGYGAASLPQSVDTTGIQTAAQDDFRNNGQAVSDLTVTSSTACGCDSVGTVTPADCDPATNPNAGTCPTAQHWVVTVSVTAQGTFNSMFNFLSFLKTLTVSNTCTMRVHQ